MSTPINLNRVRKARARDAKRVAADENAVKFGRTKGEKAAERQAEETRVQHIDRHKREP